MPKQKSKCRVRVTKQFEEAAFELIETGVDLKTYPIKKFVRKASTNMASFYRRFSSIEEVVYLFFAKRFMDWYNVQNHSFFSSSIVSQMTSLFIAIYSLERPLQCLINHDKLYYFKKPLHDFLAFLLAQNKELRPQDINSEIDFVFCYLYLWLKVDRTITPGRIANNWFIKQYIFLKTFMRRRLVITTDSVSCLLTKNKKH
jgi:hypothetical protein